MKRKQEIVLQSECFVWFNNNYCLKMHNPRYMMYVQPNEIASTVGGILKGLGVPNSIVSKAVSIVISGLKSAGFLDGVSDNIIVAPNAVYFVEFKLPTNNQQQNQINFEKRVNDLGHTYVVIKSLEQFKDFVNKVVLKRSNELK